MALLQESQFFSFNLGHVVEMGGFVVAFLTYRADRSKELKRQDQMHAENRVKLDGFADFTRSQAEINNKRDDQLAMLAMQTATLMQMAAGHERRLEMMENRNR